MAIKKHALTLFVTTVLFALGLLFANSYANLAGASAPSGLPATIASSSSYSLTTTASTLFATSSCSARIVTTQASPIMLTFSDYSNQTPTAMYGHLQAASTTVAYDSGLYGCGLVKVYSFTTATTTVSESR